jgi:hypothetical protein
MKGTVPVPDRHKMTTLEYWMKQVVSPRAYLEHVKQSPDCKAQFFDLAMAVDKKAMEGSDGIIGVTPEGGDPAEDIFEKFDKRKEEDEGGSTEA